MLLVERKGMLRPELWNKMGQELICVELRNKGARGGEKEVGSKR
jgi:hypothetical protein